MAKTLIIYFSMTGHTEQVAHQMAKSLGADLFRIREALPYSKNDLDWTNPDCRANLEQKNSASRPLYQGNLPDIADYDTVIFGHPIWWGIPPRILYTVIEGLDLTGKRVASFATSGGSSYGEAQLEMDWLLDRSLRGRILSNMASISSWLTDNQLKK
jgi:flavodoxin